MALGVISDNLAYFPLEVLLHAFIFPPCEDDDDNDDDDRQCEASSPVM